MPIEFWILISLFFYYIGTFIWRHGVEKQLEHIEKLLKEKTNGND